MAEQAKHVVCKPDNLSSVPETTSKSLMQLVSIYGERQENHVGTQKPASL